MAKETLTATAVKAGNLAVSSATASAIDSVFGAQALTFGRATFYFYPAKFAWTRIQGLHKAAHQTRPDGKHLKAARARAAFKTATECVIGQFLVSADASRLRQFDHLLDAIAAAKSFEGLVTPFLSGLNTASLNQAKARVQRAATLWQQYGATAHTGTSGTAGYLVDGTTKSILVVSSKHFVSLAPGGAKASMMTAENIGHLSVQLQGAGLADVGVAQDGDACKGGFKLGFGIVGAVLGGSASGAATLGTTAVGGAVVGFGAGAVVGDIVGDFVCGSAKTGSDAGAGGAPSAGTGDQSTSNEDNQSSQQDQSAEENQSSQEDQSSQDDSSGDNSGDNSGDDHDNGGGMPNPDDPNGIPNPDDPRGSVGFSDTYPTAGADALVGRSSSGAWICSGAPQLTATGGLAVAGALAAIPGVAALVGAHTSVANQGISQIGAASVGAVAADVATNPGNIATPAVGAAHT